MSREPAGLAEQHRSGRNRNYRLDPWVIGLSALNAIGFVTVIVVILGA